MSCQSFSSIKRRGPAHLLHRASPSVTPVQSYPFLRLPTYAFM